MPMENRTTVGVKKARRDAAGEVKDEFGESWNDVLQFYENHRADVSLSDSGQSVDTDALAESLAEHIDYPESQDAETIVKRISELESRLPEKVGDEVEGRLR